MRSMVSDVCIRALKYGVLVATLPDPEHYGPVSVYRDWMRKHI